MKKSPFADLKHFLGTVFHSDWTIEHESYEHAIRKFARRADEKTRKGVLSDIHRLTTEHRDEDLENFVCEDCKGDIFPPALGFTYSNWIKHAGEIISSTPMTRRVDPEKRAANKAAAAAKKGSPAKKRAPVQKGVLAKKK